MMKLKKLLNVIIGACLGCYVGHCIFILWNHEKHPEMYAMQSAPWYTSIWVNGILTLTVVVLCMLIKWILYHIEKKKAEKP